MKELLRLHQSSRFAPDTSFDKDVKLNERVPRYTSKKTDCTEISSGSHERFSHFLRRFMTQMYTSTIPERLSNNGLFKASPASPNLPRPRSLRHWWSLRPCRPGIWERHIASSVISSTKAAIASESGVPRTRHFQDFFVVDQGSRRYRCDEWHRDHYERI